MVVSHAVPPSAEKASLAVRHPDVPVSRGRTGQQVDAVDRLNGDLSAPGHCLELRQRADESYVSWKCVFFDGLDRFDDFLVLRLCMRRRGPAIR